jgi:hypothetical protein
MSKEFIMEREETKAEEIVSNPDYIDPAIVSRTPLCEGS